MSRLRMVVPGYVEEPEPPLVQYEYLRRKRQDAAVSQEETGEIDPVAQMFTL